MISIEYIILGILLIFACIFSNKRHFTNVAFIYMIILGMMRGLEVGTDHLGYESDFYLIKTFKSMNVMRHDFEIGYVSFMLLFKKFSNDYLTFASLAIPVTLWGFWRFIEAFKVNKAYSLSLFYFSGMYFATFNVMRQMMAIGVILGFINWLLNKKYLKYGVLIIIVSLLFHKSTLISLVLIPIHYYSTKHAELPKKHIAIVAGVCFAAFFVGKEFVQNTSLAILLSIGLGDRYDGYLSGMSEGDISNLTATMLTIYFLIWLYFKNKSKNVFISWIYFIYIATFNIFQMLDSAAGRISYPFWVFVLIAIPKLLEELKGKIKVFFILITIVVYAALFINNYWLNNTNGVNPYIWRTL